MMFSNNAQDIGAPSSVRTTTVLRKQQVKVSLPCRLLLAYSILPINSGSVCFPFVSSFLRLK